MINDKILFLDIETVSQEKEFCNVSEKLKFFWAKKNNISIENSLELEESYSKFAGIYAEFGKIICISIGYYSQKYNTFRVKSFKDNIERDLLINFCNILIYFEKYNYSFFGHNIKEFDIPYISRRLLINKLVIPKSLDFQSKKPWETNILDSLQMWKFGDYKHYISLDLLTTIFDIPSSKNDIDGSMVSNIYWYQNDLNKISEYCNRDVIATFDLYCRMKNLDIIDRQKIEFI